MRTEAMSDSLMARAAEELRGSVRGRSNGLTSATRIEPGMRTYPKSRAADGLDPPKIASRLVSATPDFRLATNPAAEGGVRGTADAARGVREWGDTEGRRDVAGRAEVVPRVRSPFHHQIQVRLLPGSPPRLPARTGRAVVRGGVSATPTSWSASPSGMWCRTVAQSMAGTSDSCPSSGELPAPAGIRWEAGGGVTRRTAGSRVSGRTGIGRSTRMGGWWTGTSARDEMRGQLRSPSSGR